MEQPKQTQSCTSTHTHTHTDLGKHNHMMGNPCIYYELKKASKRRPVQTFSLYTCERGLTYCKGIENGSLDMVAEGKVRER